MMRHLLFIAEAIERGVAAIGRAAGWLALAMVIVIVADVVLRRWFVIGSTKLQELEWHLHGALFLLTLGYAYLKGAHVRIELVHERLGSRAKAWIEFCGLLAFLLPYCVAVFYFGVDYTGRAFATGEASPSPTGLGARWVIKSTLVLGFTLLAAAGLARLLRASVYLFGPPSLAEASGFARGEGAASHPEEERT